MINHLVPLFKKATSKLHKTVVDQKDCILQHTTRHDITWDDYKISTHPSTHNKILKMVPFPKPSQRDFEPSKIHPSTAPHLNVTETPRSRLKVISDPEVAFGGPALLSPLDDSCILISILYHPIHTVHILISIHNMSEQHALVHEPRPASEKTYYMYVGVVYMFTSDWNVLWGDDWCVCVCVCVFNMFCIRWYQYAWFKCLVHVQF